jgi:hypothetical protein
MVHQALDERGGFIDPASCLRVKADGNVAASDRGDVVKRESMAVEEERGGWHVDGRPSIGGARN